MAAARKLTGKETSTERLERETVQEIGSVVAPSILEGARQVLAYVKVPGEGSRYRVLFASGTSELVSLSRLKQLLREDIAEEALS